MVNRWFKDWWTWELKVPLQPHQGGGWEDDPGAGEQVQDQDEEVQLEEEEESKEEMNEAAIEEIEVANKKWKEFLGGAKIGEVSNTDLGSSNTKSSGKACGRRSIPSVCSLQVFGDSHTKDPHGSCP